MKKVYQLSEGKFAMYFVSPWLKEHGFTYTREFLFADLKAPWLTSVLDYLAIDAEGQEWLVEVKPEFTSGEKPRKPDAISSGCKKACQQITRYARLYTANFPEKSEHIRTMLVVPANNLTAAETEYITNSVDQLVTIEIPYAMPFIYIPTTYIWLKFDLRHGWLLAHFANGTFEELIDWYQSRLPYLTEIEQEHLTWLIKQVGGQS